MDPLTDIDKGTAAEEAAWRRLELAELELADAQAAVIETTNRERSKERTRPKLRLLDGGSA